MTTRVRRIGRNPLQRASLAALLGAALAAPLPGAAQRPDNAVPEMRELPAAAGPPEELELEKRQRIPDPPAKRPSVEELAELIRKQPGGPERLEKALKGERPGQGKQSRSLGAEGFLSLLNPLRVEPAQAANTFTLTLTPQVDPTTGMHRSLLGPDASAEFLSSGVSWSNPSSQMAGVGSGKAVANVSASSNGLTRLYFKTPAAGWYIINARAYWVLGRDSLASRWIALKHLQSADIEAYSVPTIQTFAAQPSWADYPSIQYLAAGYYTFFHVYSHSGAYVSRFTVDSYP